MRTFRKAFERQVPNYPASVVDALFADSTMPQHWATAHEEHAAYAQSIAQVVAALIVGVIEEMVAKVRSAPKTP